VVGRHPLVRGDQARHRDLLLVGSAHADLRARNLITAEAVRRSAAPTFSTAC